MSIGLASAGTNMPIWAVLVSVALHGGLGGLLAASKACKPDDSHFDQPFMEVAMVPLPKAAGRLPDRASRAPAPSQGAPDTPAPPKQSNPDQMRFEDPTKDKQQGSHDHSDARRDLLADLKRQKALDALRDAPIGPTDRMATDPDSTLTAEEVFGLGGGVGGPIDEEAARYLLELRAAILPHWYPLHKTIDENPDIATVLDVWITDKGRYKAAEIRESSGDESYDRSCLVAVAKAGTLPVPPGRYRVETRKGIHIVVTLRGPDATQ